MFITFPIPSRAFEVTTHSAITDRAWTRFIATDPNVLVRLGIKDSDNAFGTNQYFDYRPADGSNAIKRNSHLFEEDIEKNLKGPDFSIFSVRGWLMRGAIREDDDVALDDLSPKEDSNGDFHRVFSHFYDPVNNRGLMGLGQTLGATAADWALIPDAITPTFNIPSVTPTPQRFNNFNLATFHESLWRATTGLNQAGVQVAYTADDRNIYWATAFRSLGDILHLNQDMAQPQHTRNDAHAGGAITILTGHKSVFERYVDARVRGTLGFSTKDDANTFNVAIGLQPIDFSNYPIPSFPRYADYWANSDQKGLANFSNSGFFSIGTLPGNSNYESPSTSIGAYPTNFKTITRWDGTPVLGGLLTSTLYIGNITDKNQPTLEAANVPLFAQGAWDQAAQGVGLVYAGITLTKSNYDAAIDLLIPRAVAYSAGLLQYSFRGKLEITAPDEVIYGIIDPTQKNSFAQIKLKLKNTTPNEDMTGGAFVAIAKFHRNQCYQSDLTGEAGAPGGIDIVGCRSEFEEIVLSAPKSATLVSGVDPQAFTFDFSQSPIPVNATDLFLQVVYRGKLGDELDAVVITTKDLFEPTHIAYHNGTDVTELNDVYYPWQQIVAGVNAGDPRFDLVDFDGSHTYNPPFDWSVEPNDFTNVRISFAGPTVFKVATIPSLPNGRFARMTVLTDKRPLKVYADRYEFALPPTLNQVNDEGTIFFVTASQLFRGVYVTNTRIIVPCVQTGSCNGSLLSIPTSIVTDALVPMPVIIL